MRSTFLRLLTTVAAFLTGLTTGVRAATITWTNNSSGSWHVAGNWSPNQVPAASDVAVFNRNVTLTVAEDVSVTELQLTGSGTLNVATGVLTAATLTWNGGWLRGAVQCGGGSIGVGTTKYLVGGALNNAGTLTWADTIWMGSDGYTATNYGVLSNLVSGVINVTADVAINGHYTGGLIYNAGQLNKTGGTGTANFYSGTLYNSGSMAISSGTLNLPAGGGSSGSLTVSGGNTIQFNGGTFTLDSSSTVTGAGNLWVSSGTVNFNGGYNLTGTNTFTGGSASFNGGYSISGPVVITSGGAYFNNVGSGVVSVPTLAMTGGGTLGGTNAVTAATFTWNGGWLRAPLSVGGGSIGVGTTKYLVGGVLNNAGTLTWADTIWMGSDGYAATNYGVISNLLGGVINVTADVNINGQYTGGLIYNAGQLNKSGGTGMANFYSGTLYNSGSMTISSGTLNLAAGGGCGGSMTVNGSNTIQFGGGTFTLDGSSIVTGAGNLLVSSGTVNFNGGYNLTGTNTFTSGSANFNGGYNLSGPILITSGGAYFNNAGSGVVNVPTLAMTSGGTLGGTNAVTAATFTWNGGWLRAPLSVGGGSIGSGTTKYLVGGVLNNAGTLTWTDTIWMGSDGYAATNYGVLSNLVGGVLDVTADVTINSHYTGGVIYNAGQLNKTGGTGTASFNNGTVYNSGSMTISSGTLNLAAGGGSSGSLTVNAGNTIQFNGGTFTLDSSSTVTGAGNLLVSSGTVNFNGGYNLTGTNTFTGGSASFNGGYNLSGPIVVTSGGAYFNNAGNGVVNVPTLAMISSGTLGGTNAVTAATFTWNGGWLRVPLSVGGGSIGVGTTKYLVGGVLNNAGGLTWADSIWMGSDGYAATNFGVLSNLVGGVINVTADVTINSHYTGGVIYNAGQLNKTGGTGTASFNNGTVYNSGSMAISSGTLNLAAGGGSSGSVLVSPGATLYFSSNFNFENGSSIGGGGAFKVASSTVNFFGTALFTNTIASLSGGSVYFNNTAAGDVTIPTLVMTGGGVLGGSNAVNAGSLTWNGGWLRTRVTCGGGSIGAGTTKYLVGGTLRNTGTLAWSDTLYLGTDGYAATNYGVISNLVSGVINLAGDIPVYGHYTGGFIYNAGSLNKTAGSGTANLYNATLYSSGSLTVNAGTLNLAAGGNSSGQCTINPGTTLYFSSNFDFNDGSIVGGGGGFTVASGTVNFNGTAWFTNTTASLAGGSVYFNNALSGAVTIPTLTMTGSGTLGGTNPIAADVLTWNGGWLRANLTSGNGSIGTGTTKYLVGGTLINVGTLAWSDTLYSGTDGYAATNYGVISNLVSGVVSVTSDFSVFGYYNAGLIYNLGACNKTGGSGTTSIGSIFHNYGALNAQTGTFNFSTSGGLVSHDGTLAFGLTSTNAYGRTTVTGPLGLNGTLRTEALAGYVPLPGDRFTLLTANPRTDTFAQLQLGQFPGVAWQVGYTPTAVSLSALAAAGGGANISGTVTDFNAQPVANLIVYAFVTAGTNQYYLSTVTDGSGQYSLDVTNGAWRVGVQGAVARGYDEPAPQDLVVAGGNQVANFVLLPYSGSYFTIGVSNNPPGAGWVTGGGIYYLGATNTLTAVASNGYYFTNWTENGGIIGTANPLVFTATTNRTFVANYAEAHPYHLVTLATSPTNLTSISGAGTYTNGETATFQAPAMVLSGNSNYFFQRFTLTNVTVSPSNNFTKTFSTLDSTNLHYVAVYAGLRTNPVLALVSASRPGVLPTNNNFTLTFRFDRPMNTNVTPVVTVTNIVSGGVAPVVSGGGMWSAYWQANDSYTIPALIITNGMDGTNLVYLAAAADTNGGVLQLTNAYSFAVDTDYPSLDQIAAVPSMTSSLITWSSDERSAGSVEYGLTPAYGATTYGGSGVTNHSITLSGLAASTTYHYRVRSTDVAGNATVSDDATFTTLAAPDLGVTNISVSGDLVSGGNLTISWADTNAGSGATYTYWYDQIIVSNLTTGAQLLNTTLYYNPTTSGNIAAGAAQSRSVNLTLPNGNAGVGSLQIIVIADAYNYQYEFNAGGTAENNNRASTTVVSALAAYPDLQVTSLTVTNAQIQSGGFVGLTWLDSNTGSGGVSNLFYDRITIVNVTNNQTLVNTLLAYDPVTSGSIAGGGSVARQFAFKLPDGPTGAGDLLITVAADSGNAVYEFNVGGTGESNNTNAIAATAALAPYPDLIVTNIIAPSIGFAGQTIQLIWSDLNQGSAAVTNSWYDQVFLSSSNTIGGGQLLATFNLTNAVAAGQSVTRTQSITLPPFVSGENWLLVKANVAASFYESNLTNNTAIAANSITLAPTLQLTLSPPVVAESAGSNATLASITRNGELTAALAVNLSTMLTNLLVPAAVTLPAGVSTTNFYLGVVDNNLSGDSVVGLVSATASGFPTTQAELGITDNDVAALTLTLSVNEIAEDAGTNAVSGLLTRNTSLTGPLTVNLTSDRPDVLLAPASVTIPAGQAAAVFSLTPIADGLLGGTRRARVTAASAGFPSVSAAVDVLNTDVVQLSLTLADSVVSEGAGNNATHGTVTRDTITASAQKVKLTRAGSLLVSVPSQVTIPANAASVDFNVSVGSDGLVSGAQSVTLVATPLSEANVLELLGEAQTMLQVLDTNGPSLALQFADPVISKGSNTLATLSRNTPPTNSVTVAFSTSVTNVVTLPASVDFGLNQTSVTFSVTGVLDGLQTGNRYVVVTAAATGFNSAARTLSVSDIYLPDLVPAIVSTPTNAYTEQQITVTWKVTNSGLGATTNLNWFDYVYLANDGLGGGQTLFAAKSRVKSLAVGESYTNAASFYLPPLPGNFWVIVEANGNRTITELRTANNTTFAPAPIAVNPAYRAELLTAAPLQAGSGTPIVLQGRTYNPTNNAPIPNRAATVRVLVNDTRRVFPVTSDVNGNFTYTFQPLANEAGDYTACADHPSVTNLSAQVAFTLLGFIAEPVSLAPQLLPDVPASGTLLLSNLTAHPLSGLAITTPDLGTNLTAQFTFTNNSLPAYGAITVGYTLQSPLKRATQLNFLATVNSAEGASRSVPMYVKVVPTFAQLAATPAYLQRGMVRGQQTVMTFTVENTGGSASGDLTVQLPGVPWLSLGSATNIPSIPAGSNAVVTLVLNPALDLPLGLYNGNIVVLNANLGLTIPYQFRAVSSAIGDLIVNVTDDYTYYVAGEPKVTNATVVLRDPFTGSIVAQTNSGPTGIAQFSGLTEGGYTVDVSAEKHNQYRGTATIAASVTNTLEAFLPRQLVTYQWSVVPTEIEDKYKIVLESVFETEVPVPNVVIEEPQVMVVVAPGAVSQFEIRLTNHGLIAANDVTVNVPYNSRYLITPLVQNIGKIPAKASVTVPVTVQLRPTVGGIAAAGAAGIGDPQADGDGGCSLEDINACLPKIPLQARYSYPCGGNNVGQSRTLDLSVICSGLDAQECWENLRELLGSGNLIGVGCNAINAFLACAGANLTACQQAAISTACGAALGGLAGAAGAGAGGALECLCSHLDDIPFPTLPHASAGNPQDVLGWLPLPPSGPLYACANPVVSYIYIPGGDCSGAAGIAPATTTVTATAAGFNQSSAPRLSSPKKAAASAGVCARVRLRITQDVVMTRSAFVGTLEIENGGLSSITGVQVTLDFRDGAGNSAATKFVTEGPNLLGLTAVDGSGDLAGGATGSAVYTFIPTTDAAPNQPNTYQIGGTLRYIDDGQDVVVPLLSAPITVYPEAKLDLVYFQQRDVYGDDPFTLPVEPSEPYTLGLIVKNIGAGDAKNFEITSAQPQIIENEKGLLIDFSIIGTRIGSNAATPSLTAKLGNIPAATSKVVTWDLLSTLQGKFISFEASFEHVNGLGQTNLSLINSIETHELIHPVRANRVTDDGVVDFLVNDFADPQNLPDVLYHSTGAVEPVNVVTNGSFDALVGPGHLQVQLTASVDAGWNYLRLPDPGPGYVLASVVRSDSKVLALTNNAWTTDRSFPSSSPGAIKENLVHLFDWAGSGSYTLTYRSTNTATPYVVQFVPVTPFTQTGAVASATIIFSEAIDLGTFGHAALTLTRDGGTNLITAASGVTVTAGTGGTCFINGLAALTGADGNYTLTVNGSGIYDVWGNNVGNTSASIAWAKGNAAPVVESISAVMPNPRNTPVDSLLVTFSKPINPATFDGSALGLVRNGGTNLITAGVAITTADNQTFAVSGLGALTGGAGDYAFTVSATNLTDSLGTAGQGAQTVTWQMITAGPQLTALSPLNTNPRNIVVPTLTVGFSHPINPATFNFADLALTRNGGANLINSSVTVTALNATNYQIGEISWLQGSAGDYQFTVNAAGISDLAGNAGIGATNLSWTMILDTPPTPTNLVIVPDLGVSATDGITSTNPITLLGSVAGSNLTVRVYDESAASDLGVTALNGTNFSLSLLLSGSGSHRLKVTAADAAGNVSAPAFKQVVWDQIRPTASIGQVLSPIYAGIDNVTITFSEGINPATISSNNFVLTRNTTNVLSPGFSMVASNVARLTGLSSLTEDLGLYQVTANLNGVADYAGNMATNLLTMSWLRDTLNQPPIIPALTNIVITPDAIAHTIVAAFDPNGDELTFSLGANAPTNAVIIATNGTFRWRPTRANASTTRDITVIATDNGNPPMSASNTFTITVLDYLDVTLGRTNLLGGATATLPLVVSSSEGVSNVQFRVTVPFTVLTNWTLVSESAQLATATLQPEASAFTVHLQTLPGQLLQGTQQVSRLEFTATTNSLSQFLPLPIEALTGFKPGNLTYSNTVAGEGRVVVVQEHPLLEGLVLPNQTRQLVVYGRPGTNYQLHVATNFIPPINWQPVTSFIQTNTLVPWPLGQSNGMFFYRLEQLP
jgi:hypothetical protein